MKMIVGVPCYFPTKVTGSGEGAVAGAGAGRGWKSPLALGVLLAGGWRGSGNCTGAAVVGLFPQA